MSADPHSRSIDGRAIGDMRIGELEPLAAKKRRDAEQYMNIAAAAAMEGGVAGAAHYRRLAQQALADHLLLQKILDYVHRRRSAEGWFV